VYFGLLCQRSVGYRCVGLCLDLLTHWSSCPLLCQYPAIFIVMALLYSLKSGIVMPPVLDFLFKIALDIQGLVFPYIFHDYFFYFLTECHWNLDRDCLGSMLIFTMLILLITGHERSFHLLKSSSISLFSDI
jgi:hypothetical protein